MGCIGTHKRLLLVSGIAGLLLAGCGEPSKPATMRIPPPPPERAAPENQGKALTPEQIEEIQRTVNVGREALKVCYTKELERRGDKDLMGKVRFDIKISPTGRTIAATIGESTLKVPKVHQCMLTAVKTWEFPKHKETYSYTTTVMFDPAY